MPNNSLELSGLPLLSLEKPMKSKARSVRFRNSENMIGHTSVLLVLFVWTARGCSPPVGGYKEPTDAKLVHFADYVVVGTVRKIIRPDPIHEYYDSTYGAEVHLTCQYKGGNIPKIITISGAGFIPGHCTSKDLSLNQEYFLFMQKRQSGYFEQTSPALNTTKPTDILDVCDLALKYPIGINSDSTDCKSPSSARSCKRYDPESDMEIGPESTTSLLPPRLVEDLQKEEESSGKQMTTTPASDSGTIIPLSALLISVILIPVVSLL